MKSAQLLRNSTWKLVLPAQYKDGSLVSITFCFLVGSFDYYEPLCFDKAQGVKQEEDAMDEEMRALLKNET